MIALLAESLLVVLIVAGTVGWAVPSSVHAALQRAASVAAQSEPMRTERQVLSDAQRSSLLFAIGIGLLLLGRIWITRRRESMRGEAPRTIQPPLLVPAVALMCGMGLALQWGYADLLHDSGRNYTGPGFGEGVLLGGLVAFIAAVIPWDPGELVRRRRWWFAGGAIIVLLGLYFFGESPGSSGARIRLFGTQPIELVKLAFVAFLAGTMGRRVPQLRYQRAGAGGLRYPRPLLLLPAAGVLTVLFGLFPVVGDLGPTLILGIAFLVLYYATTRSLGEIIALLLVAGTATAVILAHPPGWLPQRVATRFEIWRDPWFNSALPGGDQLAAALWAMAAGGLNGQGLGHAAVGALPAGHTDLILAHLAEVLGWRGLVLYLLALLALVVQGAWIGAYNRTTERMVLAFGLVALLFAQWWVIDLGTMGLLPLTGIVVPFLSFGRSAMASFLLLVGVLMRLAAGGHYRADLDEMRELRGGMAWSTLVMGAVVAFAAAVGFQRTVLSDATSARPVLTMGKDETVFLRYNPRVLAIARRIPRGEIRDRNGRVLATNGKKGRSYPLGADLGTLLGAYGVKGVPLPPWALEGLHDDTLRGLKSNDQPLGVWIERRPDDTDPATGRPARDRVLFVVQTDVLREEDRRRAEQMLHDGGKWFFTRLLMRDYSPLVPLLHLHGTEREAAISALASDIDARSVRITVDARLQQRVAAILRSIAPQYGKAGAAVVIDPATGQVLARAQWPDIDPGAPESWAGAVRRRDPRIMGSYGPWPDKTGLRGVYQAGSIFKLVSALAWAREHPSWSGEGCVGISTSPRFACNQRDATGHPFIRLDGWSRAIHDAHQSLDGGADGKLDLAYAIEVSCNVYFAQLGISLGPEAYRRLVQAGLDVGFGRGFEPGGPGSFRLASTAYGQGAAAMSAVQAARVVAAIGDGGTYRRCPPDMALYAACTAIQLVEDPASMTPILAGMAKVIDSGTARRLVKIRGVRVYGKTGTADDPGRVDERPFGIRQGATARPHSWFVALAEPGSNDPCAPRGPRRLAVAVVVPRGGYGATVAGRIAIEIIGAANDLGYFSGV